MHVSAHRPPPSLRRLTHTHPTQVYKLHTEVVGLVLFLLEWSRDNAAAASDPLAASGAGSIRRADAQLEDATYELADRLAAVLDAIKRLFAGGDVELTISTSMRQTLDDYEVRRAPLTPLAPPLLPPPPTLTHSPTHRLTSSCV